MEQTVNILSNLINNTTFYHCETNLEIFRSSQDHLSPEFGILVYLHLFDFNEPPGEQSYI